MNWVRKVGERSLGQIANPRSVAILICCLFSFIAVGRTDEGETKSPEPRQLIPEKIGKWKMTLTVRGGGGLEALRLGWHSVEISTDGNATVLKHHSVDVSDEKAMASSNAAVIFRDTPTEEQRTVVFRAAAAAVNNFELQRNRPGGSVSEDGWRVALKITTNRREVSVVARELGSVRDAGDDFPRLIDEINKLLPAKSSITFQ
jgi:hypothetical protein